MKTDELKLIEKARVGDVSARNVLMTKYDETMRRAVCSVIGRRDAEDFLSAGVEGMLRALRTFDVSRGASFKTYLYRAVIFATIRDRRQETTMFAGASERRRRYSVSPLTMDDAALARTCSRYARIDDGTDDGVAWLRSRMMRLRDDMKAVIGLRMAGWTLRRIAALLGQSVTVVRGREAAAVKALRRMAGLHDGTGPAPATVYASYVHVGAAR